jgi:hypothetical protein
VVPSYSRPGDRGIEPIPGANVAKIGDFLGLRHLAQRGLVSFTIDSRRG